MSSVTIHSKSSSSSSSNDNTNSNNSSSKQLEEETKMEDVSSLDEDETDVEITLESKDGKKFKITKKWASVSNLIKTTTDQDKSAHEVPIPGVQSAVLKLVVEYMNHHQGSEPEIIPKPLRSKEMKSVCPDEWDATFIDKIGEKRQDLYDLILAANYLDIKALLHLGCAKVASLIKGQPLEKIKEILGQGTPHSNQDTRQEVKAH